MFVEKKINLEQKTPRMEKENNWAGLAFSLFEEGKLTSQYCQWISAAYNLPLKTISAQMITKATSIYPNNGDIVEDILTFFEKLKKKAASTIEREMKKTEFLRTVEAQITLFLPEEGHPRGEKIDITTIPEDLREHFQRLWRKRCKKKKDLLVTNDKIHTVFSGSEDCRVCNVRYRRIYRCPGMPLCLNCINKYVTIKSRKIVCRKRNENFGMFVQLCSDDDEINTTKSTRKRKR